MGRREVRDLREGVLARIERLPGTARNYVDPATGAVYTARDVQEARQGGLSIEQYRDVPDAARTSLRRLARRAASEGIDVRRALTRYESTGGAKGGGREFWRRLRSETAARAGKRRRRPIQYDVFDAEPEDLDPYAEFAG